jgi:uncharacterized membrane protein YkgB
MVQHLQQRAGYWMANHTQALTRGALGIVFLWFGLLKFCPGLCDVELMAQQTMTLLTFHTIPPPTCLHILAVWECAMGLTLLLAPRHTRVGAIALRVCVISIFLHLAGTFLPLLLFPAETWKHLPYAPTLAGQYILKNMVLLAAAVSVGANAFEPLHSISFVRAAIPAAVPTRRFA